MPDGSSLPEIKISQLPVGTEANLTDLLEASQVGSGGYVSASLTVAQVAATVAGTLPAPPTIPTTLPPSGAAGGALAGTYPNPTLVGGPLSNYAPVSSLAGYLPLAGGQLTAGATLGWTAHSQITSPVDGNLLLTNNAGASFGYLQFGGTSNAFPALQRNGNQLTVMLADGSNRATLAANNFSVSNGLFYGAFGSIASPGIDGQFQFWNNAGTAASRLDIATDGTIKFKNRTNTADAIATFATQPTTQNDNSGATTAFVKAALAGGSIGWRQIGAQTPAGAATVDVTSVPVDINQVQVFFDVWPSVNDVDLLFQFYNASSVLLTANYVFSAGLSVSNSTLGQSVGQSSSSSAGITGAIALDYVQTNNRVTNSAGNSFKGRIDIFDIRNATRTAQMQYCGNYINGAGGALMQLNGGGMYNGGATATTGFRLSFNGSSTITGSVTVWGSP